MQTTNILKLWNGSPSRILSAVHTVSSSLTSILPIFRVLEHEDLNGNVGSLTTRAAPMRHPFLSGTKHKAGLGRAFHGLQFSQGYDVTLRWAMPNCLVTQGIVIVEAAALLVIQLPPLVLIALADVDI